MNFSAVICNVRRVKVPPDFAIFVKNSAPLCPERRMSESKTYPDMKRALSFTSVILIVISLALSFEACGKGRKNEQKEQGSAQEESQQTIDEDKIAVALTFINAYVENCNKSAQSEDIVQWACSNDLATDGFKTELKSIIDEAYRQDPEFGLDADPIFDAQDYPDEGFELESFDRESGLVILRGKTWTEFKVAVRVGNENGKWLVDGCGTVNIPEEMQITR